MKFAFPLLAALVLTFPAAHALAQSNDAQQACEGDVYDLCGDKIPDRDAIEACLRKKWSKVSKECRHVMATYGKKHRTRHKSRETKGQSSGPSGY